MTNWTKLPALVGTVGGCLNCGVRPDTFTLDGVIAVGFGCAALMRGGRVIYEEIDGEEPMTGAQAESIAAADPDHDWRIVLYGPLSGREYQRHGPNEWALIHQDQGFA